MGYTSNQRVLKMVYQFLLRKASIKKLGNNTMATTQTQSHLPTPITKPGLSYGKNVIATINNRWVHIQSKDFDGDLLRKASIKIGKQYHGSYSATEPPTNTNYKTRQKGHNEKIGKQYHGSYSATEPPTNTNTKPG